MKKMVFIAMSALAGLCIAAAGPAQAATGSLAPGQVPYCSSTTGQKELAQGEYEGQLAMAGQTISSIDIWNGCVKVIYSDASGHSSTAIYDPDTLQLLKTMGDNGSLG